jgi:hypothetical protein
MSFSQRRFVIGTKHAHHDDESGDDTYETQIGYSITSKVESGRCHFR